jgi:hypothetical protein
VATDLLAQHVPSGGVQENVGVRRVPGTGVDDRDDAYRADDGQDQYYE